MVIHEDFTEVFGTGLKRAASGGSEARRDVEFASPVPTGRTEVTMPAACHRWSAC